MQVLERFASESKVPGLRDCFTAPRQRIDLFTVLVCDRNHTPQHEITRAPAARLCESCPGVPVPPFVDQMILLALSTGDREGAAGGRRASRQHGLCSGPLCCTLTKMLAGVLVGGHSGGSDAVPELRHGRPARSCCDPRKGAGESAAARSPATCRCPDMLRRVLQPNECITRRVLTGRFWTVLCAKLCMSCVCGESLPRSVSHQLSTQCSLPLLCPAARKRWTMCFANSKRW